MQISFSNAMTTNTGRKKLMNKEVAEEHKGVLVILLSFDF